jgi:hypothetical protein
LSARSLICSPTTAHDAGGVPMIFADQVLILKKPEPRAKESSAPPTEKTSMRKISEIKGAPPPKVSTTKYHF